MCVTFFVNKPKTASSTKSSNLSFVLLFNREEIRTRVNTQVKKYGNVICGIDNKTGNTWLAINTKTRRIGRK